MLGNKVGGYSGPGIKPIGVRAVYEAYPEIRTPIIGVGGINSGADAIEYIMAGAKAVQIGSAVREHGPEVFSKVCSEMSEFMRSEGYRSVKEMVGVANEK